MLDDLMRSLLGDGPIIISPHQNDFYKTSMGNFIWTHHRDVKVTFGLKNRSKTVRLQDEIREGELREQLDHVRQNVRYKETEIRYDRGTTTSKGRTLSDSYVDEFMPNFKFPEYELRWNKGGGNFDLEFYGDWPSVSKWEIPAMEIINNLRTRSFFKKLSVFERQAFIAEGITQLRGKIKFLREHPHIVFSNFGVRRAAFIAWLDYIDGVLSNELSPSQFRGTSCIWTAMKYGLLPMGTNAHELPMVLARNANTAEEFAIAQLTLLRQWWDMYGEDLSIFLPDTFGSDFFLRNLPPEMAARWRGPRLDSGDPFIEAKMWLDYYGKNGIDSKTKIIIPSDGLELPLMNELTSNLGRFFKLVSHGWGTNLTFDFGDWLKPFSMVVKPIVADGVELAKVPNNPEKSMGPKARVEHIVRVTGHRFGEAVECKY